MQIVCVTLHWVRTWRLLELQDDGRTRSSMHCFVDQTNKMLVAGKNEESHTVMQKNIFILKGGICMQMELICLIVTKITGENLVRYKDNTLRERGQSRLKRRHGRSAYLTNMTPFLPHFWNGEVCKWWAFSMVSKLPATSCMANHNKNMITMNDFQIAWSGLEFVCNILFFFLSKNVYCKLGQQSFLLSLLWQWH